MDLKPHNRWQSCCSSTPNTQGKSAFHTRPQGPLWPGQFDDAWFCSCDSHQSTRRTSVVTFYPSSQPSFAHPSSLPLFLLIKPGSDLKKQLGDITDPHFKPPPPSAPQRRPSDAFPVKHQWTCSMSTRREEESSSSRTAQRHTRPSATMIRASQTLVVNSAPTRVQWSAS